MVLFIFEGHLTGEVVPLNKWGHMYFKHDRASPHFSCEVSNFHNDHFPGWSIRCEVRHSWPAGSSDSSPPLSCMGMGERKCLEHEVWNAMCIAGSHFGCSGLHQKQSLGSEQCLPLTAKWWDVLLLKVGFFKWESVSTKGSFMKLNLEFKFISSVYVYYLFCILLAFKQFSWCLNFSAWLADNKTEIIQHVL
jgi:hypothetical protein